MVPNYHYLNLHLNPILLLELFVTQRKKLINCNENYSNHFYSCNFQTGIKNYDIKKYLSYDILPNSNFLATTNNWPDFWRCTDSKNTCQVTAASSTATVSSK